MKKDALISSCGKYRYHLERHWGDVKPCLFIMLNPSTADGRKDDSTIKRCVAYAMSWGYGKLYVINLFALRDRGGAAPLAREKNAMRTLPH